LSLAGGGIREADRSSLFFLIVPRVFPLFFFFSPHVWGAVSLVGRQIEVSLFGESLSIKRNAACCCNEVDAKCPLVAGTPYYTFKGSHSY
jgi:hypothetical protein